MSHWVVRDGWYHGSQLLQPLASAAGVQLDKLNYVVAGFSCILFGTFYRTVLHPAKVTPLARKLFTFLIGFFVLYFCFGGDIKHMFVQTAVSYMLMVYCPIESLPRISLFFCLFYQSVLHAIRMYYDYEGYTLDITGKFPPKTFLCSYCELSRASRNVYLSSIRFSLVRTVVRASPGNFSSRSGTTGCGTISCFRIFSQLSKKRVFSPHRVVPKFVNFSVSIISYFIE